MATRNAVKAMGAVAKSPRFKAAQKAREGMIADVGSLVPGPAPIGQIFSPTASQRLIVCALVACDVRQEAIAAYLRIDDRTLRKYFQHELANGFDRFEANLSATLAAKALQGNLTAIVFLLKAKFGWRENPKSGGGNGTITIDQLSDDAQAEIITNLRASIVAATDGGGAS